MSCNFRKILAFLALMAFQAVGYEIPFGKGTDAGDTDLYLVPGGRGRIILKYASIPLVALKARSDSNGRAWQSSSGIIATANDDGTVSVRYDDFLNAGTATLVFANGRLKVFQREGDELQREKDKSALCAHPKKHPSLQQLWRPRSAEQMESAKALWWRGDERLRLGYFNPNAAGMLFAELAVLFAALSLLVFQKRWVRIACAALAAGALVALTLTGSRGSLIAFIVGVSAVTLIHFRGRIMRRKVLAGLLLSIAVLAVAMFVAGLATDGRFGRNILAMDEGNVQRIRCWATAPEMMAVAPDGWGDEPGRAYCDWFQDAADNHGLYYLVNSHLTWMVQHGRMFRCAYAAAWIALFALLLAFARRSTARVAIGVWGTFAVGLWFSTVGIFPTLWIVPVLCGGVAIVGIGREIARTGIRTGMGRIAVLLGAAILLGSSAMLAVEAFGRKQANKRAMPVRFDGHVVRIGHGDVRTAILRDDVVLSGDIIGVFGHELREWLVRNPSAGTILVANRPEDLPKDVDRLVAAGKGAARYLKHRAEHFEGNAFCHARETVFLSPPFSPTAVPLTLATLSDVRIVIGEFAAQYDSGYIRERSWVSVIPDVELYIPGWPELVLAVAKGGPR